MWCICWLSRGWLLNHSQTANGSTLPQVQLADGRALALGCDKLVFSPNTRVNVQHLSKAEYNGKWGKVVEYDRTAGRYVIALSAHQNLKLKPTNVRL